MTIEQLPDTDNVVFTHYHCDNFNQGHKIHKLTAINGSTNQVCSWDCGKEDKQKEIKAIEAFHNFITIECNRFTITHWNQNRPEFGPAHINERYLELTGKELHFSYPQHIDLSNYLWKKYGNNYIDHPRLDNLALLNNFLGTSDDPSGRSYPTQRVMLIAKIYSSEIRGKLKTNLNSYQPAAKPFISYLNGDAEKLHAFLKAEYAGKKGKMIAVMIHALKQLGLIAYYTRTELFDAIRVDFGDIGSNESINKYLRLQGFELDYSAQSQIKEHSHQIRHLLNDSIE